MPHAPHALPAERDPGLDVARALAVALMVCGHTLDATLTAAARSSGLTGVYWHGRGMTGVLFLLVSGWAFGSVLLRPGAPVPWKRVGVKVGLLFLVGSTLNWPTRGFDALAAGSPALWAKLLAFGPLQCIAVAMAFGLLVGAASGRQWVRAALFAGLAAGVAGVAAARWFPPGTELERPFRQMLSGGLSQYPLLPWLEFFFVGAALSCVVRRFGGRVRAGVLIAIGISCAVVSGETDPAAQAPEVFRNALLRFGGMVSVLGLSQLSPEWLGARVAPLAKRSLWIYAVHLPVVYGLHEVPGLAGRIGRRLSTPVGLLLALAVLVGSTAIVALMEQAGRSLKAAFARWAPAAVERGF